MTVTHPSVMALKPVTEGRHPVRVTAPKVTTARPRTIAPPREQQAVVDPIAAAQERVLIERRTQLAIRLTGVAFKVLAVAGMLMIAYLAVSQNWIGAATDGLMTWYTGTIAPYLSMNPVPPELPVGNGALFTDAATPAFVLPD